MNGKRCKACGRAFRSRPQVPNQQFCSLPECQRERRRRWQAMKMRTDPDYRENQSRAQRAWLQRNPQYWRDYRATHPEYVRRNVALQRGRRQTTRNTVAKMDERASVLALPAGTYRLQPVSHGVAKMDEWIVEIAVVTPLARRKKKSAKR